jgi:hypothetical protein
MVMVHGAIRGSRLAIAFSSLAWMRNTVELQHERAAGHHSRPSRKEVPDTSHTNTHHHMTPHHMTSQSTTHPHITLNPVTGSRQAVVTLTLTLTLTHSHTHTHSLTCPRCSPAHWTCPRTASPPPRSAAGRAPAGRWR